MADDDPCNCVHAAVFLSPESGVINFLLKLVGVDPVAFLAKPNAFKWVYVLSGIWQTVGWSAIIYIAALSGVDKNLLEAAEIDGANRLQRIRYVNFPVLIPTIVIMFILRCGWFCLVEQGIREVDRKVTSLAELSYTKNEAKERSTLVTDITSYVEQMVTQFITGEADIDATWETYVNTLKQMGLDRWLEIDQTAYSRTK